MLHGGLTLQPLVPGTQFGFTVTSRRKGRRWCSSGAPRSCGFAAAAGTWRCTGL